MKRSPALLLLLLAGTASASPPARPNVLLVTLDTMRADRLGAYGAHDAGTPALDRLAARGTVFDDAQTSCPLTLPSHATMLTGLQPPEHGIRVNGRGALADGVPTLAERLAAVGYHTGAFVAAAVLDARYGLARGFDVYDDALTGALPQSQPEPLSVHRPGDRVTDAALAWLEGAARGGRPFFAWVHLYDAHQPYVPHPELTGTRFAGVASYEADVAFVDRQVARLLRFLDAQGLAGNTIVVAVADHGEGLGDHDEAEHGYLLNDEVLRVPWIVAGPGVRAGRRVAATVAGADLAPTLLELAGVAAPSPPGARSLAAALRGAEIAPEPVYAETDLPFTAFAWSPLRSLTTAAWKYVRTPDSELYDRATDRGERRNLAAARPEVVRELEAALAAREAALLRREAGVAPVGADERRRLEALGYLVPDGETTPPPSAPLRDVKAMLPLKHRHAWLRAAIQQGTLDVDQRVAAAADLVRRSPETPAFRLLHATALNEAGRQTEAVSALEETLRLRPDFAEAHHNLGSLLLRRRDLDGAAGHFAEAARLDPGFSEPLLGMGAVEVARGRYVHAARDYRRAVRVAPRSADANLNLANALVRVGWADKASRHYETAIALKPDFAPAHYGLGLLLADIGRPVRALAELRKAVRFGPQLASAHYQLGKVLAEQARYAQAILSYREAIRLEPSTPEYWDDLAATYAAAGRRADALATAGEAATRARRAGRTALAADIERRAGVYRQLARS